SLLHTSSGLPVIVDAANKVLAPQVTDLNGKYLFSNLPPSDYFVQFDLSTLPAGAVPTHQNSGDDTLDSDGDATGKTAPTGFLTTGANLTLDMGIITPDPAAVRVGDYVWDDLNANGRQESGEPGLANVRATLLRSDGVSTGLAARTDSGGYYLFANLPPGNYFVSFDRSSLPAGTVFSPQNAGTDDSLDSDADPTSGETAPTGPLAGGNQNLTLDLGVFRPASLGDFVWLDANADGVQEADEGGVAAVTVALFDGQGRQVATTVTNAGGYYHFTGLRPGAYYVVFTLPANLLFSQANAGGDRALDSDADPATGRTATTLLTSGETDLTWDAGLTPSTLAALGGHTWHDGSADQADGNRTPDETLLAGVTVILLDVNGKELKRTTTAANGFYSFEALTLGAYILSFIMPDGFTSFTINHDSANNSDADLVTGQTVLIRLAAGERDLTWDAGFVLLPTALEANGEPPKNFVFLPVVTK
ncbi:MAG: carboxypeptidase regulatory-like domain-containing protein, partial [Chloroflexota bacterium]|nr:carboxypeptidase regulatory-like domain-containing protein [Chloroflexota bacterium]